MSDKIKLIKEFRRIQELFPTKEITRSLFRKESELSEHSYLNVFGSFTAFKKEAVGSPGIVEKKLLRSIQKHTSLDKLREVSDTRIGYEGKYQNPSNERWQTIMAAADIHDLNCDPFFRRTFLDTAKRVQPNKIVLNGDIFDLPEFSKYTNDPRNYNILARIRWVHTFLKDLRNNCQNSEIILVERKS